MPHFPLIGESSIIIAGIRFAIDPAELMLQSEHHFARWRGVEIVSI